MFLHYIREITFENYEIKTRICSRSFVVTTLIIYIYVSNHAFK
jgi:hypothetical protein